MAKKGTGKKKGIKGTTTKKSKKQKPPRKAGLI